MITYRSVDYLDEIEPGSFRQAQVTFHSRLPHVFPIGDAMSMSANVLTYSDNSPLEILQSMYYLAYLLNCCIKITLAANSFN